VAYREVHLVQIVEVIRRWQLGESRRSIARATGLSRNTVEKYVRAALAAGVGQGGGPPGEEVLACLLQQTQPGPTFGVAAAPLAALLEAHREQIDVWLSQERLQVTRVHELLLQQGVTVSYTTLRRFLRHAGLAKVSRSTVRMAEWPPGEVAEMDFGRLGILEEASGKRRAVWALVIVLPYSRHSFVWPLYRQTLEEVISGLEVAWRFFRGVPKRLILDNFPAAVAGPDQYDPRPTRGFLEYSQARGFLADPARVRHPKDKPHVERGVQYVRERFFKGGSFRDLEDVRLQAERWCRDVAGLRIHGTTRKLPLEVFLAEEQAKLQAYDGVVYEAPLWREAKVHLDHHISFAQALYSLPSTICPPGSKVEVRGDSGLVRIYRKGELVKTHVRRPPGGRATDPADYPAEKTPYALRSTDRIIQQARELGASVASFAEQLFEGPLPWAKLRQGQKLLRLAEKYSAARLDAACAHSLAHELVDVRRLERILVFALEQPVEPRPAPAVVPLSTRFARPGSAFDHRRRHRLRAPAGQGCLPLEVLA
jgi:transposase